MRPVCHGRSLACHVTRLVCHGRSHVCHVTRAVCHGRSHVCQPEKLGTSTSGTIGTVTPPPEPDPPLRGPDPASEPLQTWDVFLSHGGPDKPWVQTLADELAALGLQPFLDVREIEPADSFPGVLSRGLADSRFLVLILSPRSSRPWVDLEWQSFIAHHGPLGRVLPVLLESTEIPALLASIQRIDATDRDAARVAREIAQIAGRPGQLKEGDVRRLVLGQDLVFNLSWEGEDLRLIDPLGRSRTVPPPWRVDNQFWRAQHFFDRLSREPVTTDADRAELVGRATTLGSLLFDLLFDEEGRERLRQARVPGRPRPLITIRSDDDSLLSLPWELLWHDGSFLLRDAQVDLARSTPDEVGPEALLREPAGPLKLMVNVSAPEGSGLDYEGESYRITKALSDQCLFVPTELGTVEDLVETVRAERPTAIHFSGHGAPGVLFFEDEEGWEDEVSIHDLLKKLRIRVHRDLPPLFYLASCHGNDPGVEPEEGALGAESSAARLHREGVPQVVGYYGPIVDELSTRAEVAFYRALAEGETTRYAVRQAREALPASSFPFAWAQLVFYHRGPDHPLSLDAAKGVRSHEPVLQRTFEGLGDRRVLTTGFIGRRSELHRVRRWIREGRRVFVFQGLGGLGKSTLAFHAIPMLQRGQGVAVTLWCQEVEQRQDRAQGLTGQLLDFCRKTFGVEWEPVAFQVDRTAGDDPVQRFVLFLQVLLQNLPRLVLYLDNLESLLVGPKDPQAENDETVLGQWASEELGRLWRILTELARDNDRLYLVASCRYRNLDFAGALLPVSPMPPDALYRLMGWFTALRQLSGPSRVRLVSRLAGHPRAVEYANDLLAHALADREDSGVPWRLPKNPTKADLELEWTELVKPELPRVQGNLWANLLLAEIWDRVLDDRARRMLYRITLLRRPWEWKLAAVLGEEGEAEEAAFATAESLRRTSLLETNEIPGRPAAGTAVTVRRYILHPDTAQFVRFRFGNDEPLRRATHRRLGDYLEAETRASFTLETHLEAGHHLFLAREYDRAIELLRPASYWLRDHGQVRESLQVLDPFLDEQVRRAMRLHQVGQLLGAVGVAHYRLGEVKTAVKCYEQALVIDREIRDRRWEGADLGNLGLAFAALGEVEKAIGYYEQALDIAREIGDRQGEGDVVGNLGTAYRRLGKVEKSIKYYEQALVIDREVGDRRGEAADLGNLGSAYLQLGELKQAVRLYEQAFVIDREIGDRQGEANALGNLGLTYAALGEVEKAIGLYEQQLLIVRGIADLQGEGSALGNLGLVYAALGETEKALRYFEQHLVIARESRDRRGEGTALGNLGLAYANLGKMEHAIEYYEQHLVIAREIGDRQGEGTALVNLGLAYARLAETEKALALLEQSLQIGRAIKDPQIVRVATDQLARLRGA
jgi:tetratricopeptide (TPR) repeat protein